MYHWQEEVQPMAIYKKGRVIGMLQKECALISEYLYDKKKYAFKKCYNMAIERGPRVVPDVT